MSYWVGWKVLSYFDSDENILLHTGKFFITFYISTLKWFWCKTYKAHAVGFPAMHYLCSCEGQSEKAALDKMHSPLDQLAMAREKIT